MPINNSVGALSNLYQVNSFSLARQPRTQAVRSFRDEMMLSAETQTFNEMLKKLRQSSEVRQDKVDEYSARIADGSYFASSTDIAAGILGVH